MGVLEILLVVGLGLILVFVLTHIRPLTEDEVIQLAKTRRGKEVRSYFYFDQAQTSVNMEFKKKMSPEGKFHRIRKELAGFPPVAAALLKYKKHEWIIVGFERNKQVELIWLNKGTSRESAYILLSAEQMAAIGKQEECTSVFVLHNHPNTDPNSYDCRGPSPQDLTSAKHYADVLNKEGLNLVEFVCERGRHYEFHLSAADTFLPMGRYVADVSVVNGKSKLRNLLLHCERIF